MSHTKRDIERVKSKQFQHSLGSDWTVISLENTGYMRERERLDKEAIAQGIKPEWKFPAYKDQFLQRWNRRRQRHHIKQILHTQQFNRLHKRDHIFKEYLD